MKRVAIIALILGLFLSILGFIIPLIYWKSYTSHSGAIGIIGGADAPTYTFMLLALFDGLPFILIVLGIGLIILSVFYLVFSKMVRKH